MAQYQPKGTSPLYYTEKAGGGEMTKSDMQGRRAEDQSTKCTGTDEQGNSHY